MIEFDRMLEHLDIYIDMLKDKEGMERLSIDEFELLIKELDVVNMIDRANTLFCKLVNVRDLSDDILKKKAEEFECAEIMEG